MSNCIKRISSRLILALLVPALVLIAVEAMFRVFSFGIDPRFVIREVKEGRAIYHENPDIGLLWFEPGMTRSPVTFSVTDKTNDLRVVILGESAAMGDPVPAFGLAPHLEAVLRRRYPDKSIEIINAAMTAIDSSIIVSIARDLAPLKPDIVVVYMGNNEIVGPFGPEPGATSSVRLSSRYARIALRVRSLRIGQLLRGFWLNQHSMASQSWQGLGQFADRTLSPTSSLLPAIYQRFEENKNAIIDVVRSYGAEPVICTMATRLNWPPFNSGGYVPDPAAESLESKGLWQEAYALYQKHEDEQPMVAEWHYRSARAAMAIGNVAEGTADYHASRDLDLLRFRADSAINRILSQSGNDNVLTVDIGNELDQLWPEPGKYFWDHVHLTPDGNYVAATAIAKAMEPKLNALGLGAAHPVPELSVIKKDVLYSEWDRLNTTALMHQRMLRPPFDTMPDQKYVVQDLTGQVRDLRKWMDRAYVESVRDTLSDAAQRDPNNYQTQMRLFRIYEELEEFPQAMNTALNIVRTWPHSRTGYNLLGRCLVRANRIEDAMANYERGEIPGTLRARMVARIEVASILAEAGQNDAALKLLNEALDLDPAYAKAWYNRALVNGRIGQLIQSEKDLRKALEFEPSMSEAFNNLGVIALKQERPEDAERHFRQALEFTPLHISALRNMAYITMKNGDWVSSRAYSEKLSYLDPDFDEVSAMQKAPVGIKKDTTK